MGKSGGGVRATRTGQVNRAETTSDGGCDGGLGQFVSDHGADNAAFHRMITPGEVKRCLGSIKNGSAAGPDGLSKKALKTLDPTGAKLAEMYSVWLALGRTPEIFKRCRTTLMPKSLDPDVCAQMSGWRPLTIVSVVTRLYSKVLNTCHTHILGVLRQRGFDNHINGVIKDSYEGVTTKVAVEGGEGPTINMRIGVKQGDPLSPLLFNLALDPVIATLERIGSGCPLGGGKRVCTLAFADDLVLLSESWEGMRRNIAILETFCKVTGLKVQPTKCHGFLAQTRGSVRMVNRCEPWSLGEGQIHMVGPGETVKYLGVDQSMARSGASGDGSEAGGLVESPQPIRFKAVTKDPDVDGLCNAQADL
ncbi:hypothetical protein DPEC_G00331570 [Dallia pectoralis]|uniref:Uncharacterized protein n=1 Tax=Dallia pectoralis TaxID=75939 RepID=A0ACC2F5U8_DALPE|nr:hypothetical protein DPEC_G00331570 [Dallia pectoralis]